MSLHVILILNAIVLLGLTALHGIWGKSSKISERVPQIIYGIFFGGAVILVMELAWGTETGIFYDSRTILIGSTAAFFSPITTILTVTIGSIYRFIIGGDGAIAGIVTIACTGLLGYLFKRFYVPRVKGPIQIHYLIFGFVIHVFMLLYHFVLPMDIEFILTRIKTISPTILTIYPVLTAIIMIFIKNNDERITNNEALVQSEQKYRLLFEGLPTGIFHFDTEGVISDTNEKFANILGTSVEKLIGLDMKILPNLVFREKLDQVLENKVSEYKGLYTSFLSGREMYLEATFYPVHKDGVQIGGVGLVQDVTNRIEFQRKLKEALTLDDLTGFKNRKAFEDEIRSNNFKNIKNITYCLISIDNLQFFFDTLDYDDYKELVVQISSTIRSNFGSNATIYKLNESDFVVLTIDHNQKTSRKIIKKISDEVLNLNETVPIALTYYVTVKENKDKSWKAVQLKGKSSIASKRVYSKSHVTKNSIDILLATLFEKSQRERYHSERVANQAKEIGKKLNMDSDALDRLKLAAILHDIGKINIDTSILDKPESLTSEEYETIKSHTQTGSRILSSVKEYEDIAKIVLSHHERWDGEGYPFNLKGEEIPLESRIISVIDSFDAMVHDRPYRKALSLEEALKELKDNAGTQFDPEVVKTFIDIRQK